MNWAELLLGQLPETLYFSLFIIYTKQLKSKRILLTVLMAIEYLLLFNVTLVSSWSHILYFAVSYAILKILYKERSQITDIFTMGLASVVLMLISIICYFITSTTVQNIIVCTIIAKVLLFTFLFLLKDKLHHIQKMYKRLWNRNDKAPKRIKTTTFRCINLIAFNVMFYVINCYILLYLMRRC